MPTGPQSSPRRAAAPLDLPALLAELDSSGQSAAAFARERGIPVWKIYRARRSARSDAAAKPHRPRRLIPVRVVDPPAAAVARPLELHFDRGHRLQIPPDFDEATLRRLLGVLAEC